jgi:phage gp36-like protein
MPYATLQDYLDTFGQDEMIDLTNLHDTTATTVNTANLTRNQEKATAVIDGMIASCPTVAAAMPFATAPAILKALELDLVRYYLDSLNPRDDVRLRYADALKQLQLIGSCQMSLGLPAATVAPNVGSPSFSSPTPVFTRDSLADF